MKPKTCILKGVNVNELERAYDKCLVWFYANPNSRIGLNELSKFIKSSKTSTKQAVELLIRETFLIRRVIGKSWMLYLNQKHRFNLIKKVPYHLMKIYETEIIEAVHREVPQARAIILFGSYRWGSDNETSDIDIAVEIVDKKELEIRQLGIISELGYRKKVKVNIHIFSRKKIEINLFSNIANGIILDGFLEVSP